MEMGVLTLATSLLLASDWVQLGAVLCVAGMAVFGYQLLWMRRNPRPAPRGRRTPDLGVLQIALSGGYLILALTLGSALALTEPGVWKMGAAMAYGVSFLLGFLAQIVVGVGSRIVPWAAYLWGFADGGFRQTPPTPHDLPHRKLHWVVVVGWSLGVPAIACGLTFDWIGLIRLGGSLLGLGVLAGGSLMTLALRRAGARFST